MLREFFADAILECFGMVTVAVFDDRCAVVRFGIFFSFPHKQAFVEFVEDNKFTLGLGEHFLDPDLAGRDEGVDAIMATLCILDQKEVAHEFSVNDPHTHCIVAVLRKICFADAREEGFLVALELREFGSKCFESRVVFEGVCCLVGTCFGNAGIKQGTLGKKVIDKKCVLAEVGFLINP